MRTMRRIIIACGRFLRTMHKNMIINTLAEFILEDGFPSKTGNSSQTRNSS